MEKNKQSAEEVLEKIEKAKTRKYIDYVLEKTDRCINSWVRLQGANIVTYACFYSAPWYAESPHWYTNACTPEDWERCPFNHKTTK